VIQDVDIPIDRAGEFLDFLATGIGIWPVWLCPIRARAADAPTFPLYPMQQGVTYVNFGFWDVVLDPRPRPPGFRNRLIEQKVTALGGVKSLYSESYYSEGEFWALHDRAAYGALKRTYDPANALGDLYTKCVVRA